MTKWPGRTNRPAVLSNWPPSTGSNAGAKGATRQRVEEHILIGLMLAASGLLSPPVALACGLLYGFSFTHAFHVEAKYLSKLEGSLRASSTTPRGDSESSFFLLWPGSVSTRWQSRSHSSKSVVNRGVLCNPIDYARGMQEEAHVSALPSSRTESFSIMLGCVACFLPDKTCSEPLPSLLDWRMNPSIDIFPAAPGEGEMRARQAG